MTQASAPLLWRIGPRRARSAAEALSEADRLLAELEARGERIGELALFDRIEARFLRQEAARLVANRPSPVQERARR
jgi:hypothetical protein